ncbi:flavin reductase family protein [Amylibacter sp. SFDW26]|uniref:flavin reductase family protein n=1 Tax=Amylibacter sp. SFDW26 TaxID=2652722 RepID=UPI001261BF4A|nr:flavin reductase family protein [Amylibacter sp. SFDW26]KAB7614394.1 flavin reductase family protein [Amylibacter sp. SFDW26]
MDYMDPRGLRDAFGTFMTGVTVVTSHDKNGNPLGFTANSFTSVSLEPPLLLVCLANSSSNYEALTQAEGFAVNILAEDQKDVSNTFARKVDDRFAAVSWKKGPHGSPILSGVSAWFDCSMHKIVEAGDHIILIGKVEVYDASTAPGLGYANGAYVTPSATAEALNKTTNLVVSAIIERADEVLLIDDGQGGLALPEITADKSGATIALNNLIASTGLGAQPGFVYSIFEDAERERQNISFLCKAGDGLPNLGSFEKLTEQVLSQISDPAVASMLERFANENSIGNYGVYVGNETSGKVRAVNSKG